MRTRAEIIERYVASRAEDPYGFRGEALAAIVDFELDGEPDPVGVEDDARAYLTHVFGRALRHRGLASVRGVTKITEYVWALGLPTEGIEAAPWDLFGAPKLAIAAGLLRLPVPTDDDRFTRMALGVRCRDGCLGCLTVPSLQLTSEIVG